MNTLDVTCVRIYLTEGEGAMDDLLSHLHDEEKVQGVTVFRGINAFFITHGHVTGSAAGY